MNSQTLTQVDAVRTSDEIEAGIRQTRDRMDATLDELGNRLTPKSLLNSAFEWWESHNAGSSGNGAAAKAAVGLARQARRHPMPALLIGSGLVWLIADFTDEESSTTGPRRHQKRDDHPRESGDSNGMVSKAGEAAADALADAMDKTKELGARMEQTTDQLSRKAHDALDKGKTTLRKIKSEATEGYETGIRGFDRACDEYPLAVGVGFAALGIFAGLLIPRTQREDQWMGEHSDHLRDETREKTQELLETGKAVGKSVVQTVQEEAEKQGITGETVAAKLSELADTGEELITKVKDEAIQTAEDRGLHLPTPHTQTGAEHRSI